jgi:hypothetical protein
MLPHRSSRVRAWCRLLNNSRTHPGPPRTVNLRAPILRYSRSSTLRERPLSSRQRNHLYARPIPADRRTGPFDPKRPLALSQLSGSLRRKLATASNLELAHEVDDERKYRRDPGAVGELHRQ